MAGYNRKVPVKDSSKPVKSQALISAAFQDHISKRLELNVLLNSTHNKLIEKSKPVKFEAKSKTDTGLKRNANQSLKKSSLFDEEKEYVLEKPNFVEIHTLAEKYGLVPVKKNDQNMNEQEWSEVKEKYKQREEFKEPCVICKEQLGSQQQVLLSCSHTFHRACLEVFERFSGKKSCPMCRKERYQTRVVHDASKHFKNVCAARIQAAWRGYLVRKWYKNYRRLVPPNNPMLRKKFFEEKLSDITNRIVGSFNFDTDALLNDIDRNIAKSRETFKNFEEKLKLIPDQKWTELLDKAVERCHEECSICMNKYDIPLSCYSINPVSGEYSKNPEFSRSTVYDHINKSEIRIKRVVLLSCSHVFHSVCLSTFEELNFDKAASCPECRAMYKKNELFIN